MQDVPDSTPNNLKVDLEDILDPDERTNDIDEERRTADHESEFYDGDKDQDGDTMPPNQLSSNNTKNDPSSSNNTAASTSNETSSNNVPYAKLVQAAPDPPNIRSKRTRKVPKKIDDYET